MGLAVGEKGGKAVDISEGINRDPNARGTAVGVTFRRARAAAEAIRLSAGDTVVCIAEVRLGGLAAGTSAILLESLSSPTNNNAKITNITAKSDITTRP